MTGFVYQADRETLLCEIQWIDRPPSGDTLASPHNPDTQTAPRRIQARAAIKAGYRVYQITLAELIEALFTAHRAGQLPTKVKFYTRCSGLIVDEIGYLLHHAIVVQTEGASYRLREHADLIDCLENDSMNPHTAPKKRRGRPPRNKGGFDL